ncbi:coiled-coil domain-containing protein [Agrilactobacillus yilanensis]|uniref:Coiled-coil domain-containing protein n=1 Tax=Agrilactobacillus yilanensis TaxID=2485997 RepID=A0ABW4J7E5_9LACO|nr:hypothetical protein [Agrilactobacillus yilanensis]
MRKVGRCLFIFLCLPFLWPAQMVQGDSVDDLQAQISAIQEQQTQLNDQLNTQMAAVSTQTVKANELQADLLQTQQAMRRAQKNVHTQQQLLKSRKKYAAKRLSTMQRQNTSQDLFTLIASADSLTDMLQRLYAVKAIQRADNLAIKNAATTYSGLKTVRQNLEEQQKTLLDQQKALADQNHALQQTLSDLKATMTANQTQMAQLSTEKTQVQAALAAEEDAKKARDQSELTAASAPSSTSPQNSTAIFSNDGLTPSATTGGNVTTGVKISFYDPAVLGSSMGYGGVAANLAVYPKGTKLKIVFADGTEIHRVVNDTGTFVYSSPNQIDVAWPNAAIPSYGITTATVTVE